MAKCSTVGGGTPQSVTIDDLVKDYLKNRKTKFDSDLERCSNIENVLKHPHQYRLPRIVKEDIIKQIKEKKLLEKPYSSFEEIYADVEKIVGGEKYLTIYDASLRIGNYKKIYPEKYCYLSRGAKEGFSFLAELILKVGTDVILQKILEILIKKAFVVVTPWILKILREYFPALKKLSPMYLEDFLCIYKDKLMNIK